MKNNKHVAKLWIEKADKDLGVAELLLKKKNQYLDLASFHCQQDFEKYLKSLIAYHGIFPERTHDLVELLNKTLKYKFELMKFIDAAKALTPYAVIPRYPNEIFDVSIPKLRSLIKKTKKLAELMKELINV